MPSFATTKARVPRSDIGTTGPLRASKVAVLCKIVCWKSEVEVLLTRGCEAVMFTVGPDGLFIEINIRKKKWLLVGTYNPNKNLISNHLKEIGKNLDNYSSKYDNVILLGDLNSEPTESAVKDLCEIYSCKNLIKDNTCFKNPLKPCCIDLIITNRPKSFQNSVTVETELSDFHKMTLTVMKVFYKKQKTNIVTYRNYKHFSNEAFMLDVKNSIIQMTSENNDLEFD